MSAVEDHTDGAGYTTLFDDTLHVVDGVLLFAYGDDSEPAWEDADSLDSAFAGQANGMLGTAWPGTFVVVPASLDGSVALTVTSHASGPAIPVGAEDVVEASFTVHGDGAHISNLDGDDLGNVALSAGTTYRARLIGSAMDAAADDFSVLTGQPTIDSYRLQLWPAPTAPDAVVQVTSAWADKIHGSWSDGG